MIMKKMPTKASKNKTCIPWGCGGINSAESDNGICVQYASKKGVSYDLSRKSMYTMNVTPIVSSLKEASALQNFFFSYQRQQI